MALIKCAINGELVEIDESNLEAFRTELDNETENTVITGYKLFGVVVQNDVNMILKQAATYVDAVAATL